MAIVSVVAVAPAHAEEIDSRPRPGPLALRAEAGLGGVAVGGEIRFGMAGLRATGGGYLVSALVSEADTHEIDSFEIYGTWQLNGELFLFPVRLASGNEIGFSLALRRSGLLGTGGGVAFELRRQLRPRLGLSVSGGFAIFPDGDERIRDQKELGPGVDLNYPFGAGLQTGATVGLNLDLF